MEKEQAKKVETKDHSGKVNGWLMELFKSGEKTVAYLTASIPGSFKGFHLHRVRAARYVCIKGKIRIITYKRGSGRWIREETILEAAERMSIPPRVATGLENIGDEEAWLINYPDPAYDPALKDEQVEYTEEELEHGILK